MGSASGSVAGRAEFYLYVKFTTGIASITVDGTKYEKSGGDKTLTFAKDKSVSVSVTAETGYNVDSGSYSSPYTMNADYTCKPTASLKTYKLTLSFNTGISKIYVSINGGTASAYTSAPSGGISITHGQTVKCTATASSGYTLNSGQSPKEYTVSGNITYSPTASADVVDIFATLDVRFTSTSGPVPGRGIECYVTNDSNIYLEGDSSANHGMGPDGAVWYAAEFARSISGTLTIILGSGATYTKATISIGFDGYLNGTGKCGPVTVNGGDGSGIKTHTVTFGPNGEVTVGVSFTW